ALREPGRQAAAKPEGLSPKSARCFVFTASRRSVMSLEPDPGNAAFWQGLYDRGSDRWELGRPTPSLAAQLGHRPPPRGTVAVPGCGRGHDARLLARQGYRVIGFA